ncbi:CASP-like protein 1B2 [Coffea arabica]|uniref:CASP-like protein n=1 Tax=Coffea arabica TaxID=13443 RepID=A0A6P6U5R0_COFAR|nr:CASP-like protein 1B2 [Coffea arabica]
MADEKVVEGAENGACQTPVVSANKANDWLIFLLRLFAFFATVSATVVMAINKQTLTVVVATIGRTPIQASVTAKFQHTPAFIFFVIANGLASIHNLLMLIVELIGHKFDFKGLRYLLIPILDMLNVALVSGGTSAAVFIGELARNGNSHAKWNKICDKFSTYCNHGGGAMIASSIGLVLMIIVTVISITKLRIQKSQNYSRLP